MAFEFSRLDLVYVHYTTLIGLIAMIDCDDLNWMMVAPSPFQTYIDHSASCFYLRFRHFF